MKKFKSSLVIISGIILILFILISTEIIPIHNSTEFILIEDPEGQAQLKSKLEESKIPISIDDRGRISYDSKYFELVQKLTKDTISLSPPSTTAFRYSEPKYTEILIEKLKNNNIPFSIEYIKDEKYVILSYKEKENWLPITREIDNAFIQEHKKSGK